MLLCLGRPWRSSLRIVSWLVLCSSKEATTTMFRHLIELNGVFLLFKIMFRLRCTNTRLQLFAAQRWKNLVINHNSRDKIAKAAIALSPRQPCAADKSLCVIQEWVERAQCGSKMAADRIEHDKCATRHRSDRTWRWNYEWTRSLFL